MPREKPKVKAKKVERVKTPHEKRVIDKRAESKSQEQEISASLQNTLELARAYGYEDIAQVLEKVQSCIGHGSAIDELLSKI